MFLFGHSQLLPGLLISKRRNRIQENEDQTPSDPSLSEIGAINERGWIICIWEAQSCRQICPNLNIEVDLAFFDTWNLFHIFNYKKFVFILCRALDPAVFPHSLKEVNTLCCIIDWTVGKYRRGKIWQKRNVYLFFLFCFVFLFFFVNGGVERSNKKIVFCSDELVNRSNE